MARLRPNPFPSDAVATSSLRGLPDYVTRYALDAEKKIDNFLEDFDGPGQPASLILGIRGRYGSGKTHLALHLSEYLVKTSSEESKMLAIAEDSSRRRRTTTSQVVYTKADRPDLYDIYRNHIVGKLKEKDLKELVAHHYSKLLDQRAETTAPGRTRDSSLQVATRVVKERSADNPQYILDLLRKDLLPVGDLPLEFEAELRDTEPSASEDFFKAYSKINDIELGLCAVRWIHGDNLSEEEARQLGVTLPRIEPKYAKQALKFLLNAYRRAGIAFLFCVDEFERFRLPAESGTEHQQAANPQRRGFVFFRRLVEFFVPD